MVGARYTCREGMFERDIETETRDAGVVQRHCIYKNLPHMSEGQA